MNADEIVRALRRAERYCLNNFSTLAGGAADLIESLQKELASLAIESVKREKALAKLEAEVAAAMEVKFGEWVEAKSGCMSVYPSGQVMCSVCGQRMPSQWKKMPPYCYGCGARMEVNYE